MKESFFYEIKNNYFITIYLFFYSCQSQKNIEQLGECALVIHIPMDFNYGVTFKTIF